MGLKKGRGKKKNQPGADDGPAAGADDYIFELSEDELAAKLNGPVGEQTMRNPLAKSAPPPPPSAVDPPPPAEDPPPPPPPPPPQTAEQPPPATSDSAMVRSTGAVFESEGTSSNDPKSNGASTPSESAKSPPLEHLTNTINGEKKGEDTSKSQEDQISAMADKVAELEAELQSRDEAIARMRDMGE
eukprot:SAG31_NODE_12171_length_962_cov_0.852839_1_plen_186_part_01